MKKPVPNYKGDEEKEEQGSGRVMFFEKENRSKEYFAPTYKSKIKWIPNIFVHKFEPSCMPQKVGSAASVTFCGKEWWRRGIKNPQSNDWGFWMERSPFRRGWGERIRTFAMTESESVALPLGDTPVNDYV